MTFLVIPSFIMLLKFRGFGAVILGIKFRD